MKIKFDLTDEVTITNTTVKLTCWISGVINKQNRPTLEKNSLELAKKLFPDAKWAFGDFSYMPDGFSYRVKATTRIDATQNDQLAKRAKDVSDQGVLTIQVQEADTSIPLHQRREAESDLRLALIEKAKTEATKLGGTIRKLEFGAAGSMDFSNRGIQAASYAVSATAKGGGADGVSLGQSEKIFLSASIVVDTADRQQLNG
jgi:hypothetical protein